MISPSTKTAASRKKIGRGRNGERGAIAVEYAFLLVVVAIPTVAGVIAGGVKLLHDYDVGRSAILAPAP
jgi:Flp pilus assembly pilin Flp